MFFFVSMFYSIPDSSVCDKHRWHMQIYATNEARIFCATDDHVEGSVLTSIKTKTVRINSLFFQVRKFFKSYSSYMSVILHLTNW